MGARKRRRSDDGQDVAAFADDQLRSVLERQGESEAVLADLVAFQSDVAQCPTERFGDLVYLRELLGRYDRLMRRIAVDVIAVCGTGKGPQVDIVHATASAPSDMSMLVEHLDAVARTAVDDEVFAVRTLPGGGLACRALPLEPVLGGPPPVVVLVGSAAELEMPYEYVLTGQRSLAGAVADGLTRWSEFIDISSKLQATREMTSIATEMTQNRRALDFFDLRSDLSADGTLATLAPTVEKLTGFLAEVCGGWNLDAIVLHAVDDDGTVVLLTSVGDADDDTVRRVTVSLRADGADGNGPTPASIVVDDTVDSRIGPMFGESCVSRTMVFDLHGRRRWGAVTYVWDARRGGGDEIFLRHFTTEIGTLVDSYLATSTLQRDSYLDRGTGYPNENAMFAALDSLNRSGTDGVLVMLGLVSVTKYLENYDTATVAELQRRILDVVDAHFAGRRSLVGVVAPSTLYALVDEWNATEAEVETMAQELVHLAGRPQEISVHIVRPAVSAGCARHRAGGHPATVVQDCYSALGEAARIGSGAVRSASSDLLDERRVRYELEREIEVALADGQFVSYFQPELSLLSGEVLSYESLVRWAHPVRGLLGPESFVPIAEENDLVVHLDLQNLERSARQFVEWGWAESGPVLRSNLSSSTMHHPGLAERIVSICRESGLSPSRLCVEVTETSIMRDEGIGVAHLSELRDAGIGVALDDFGIGTSSLARLRTLPISVVKMDRAFVTPLPGDAGDRAFVAAIASMAAAVGLDITAEGVETEQQRDALAQLGFTKAQGYLFAAPLTADEVTSMVEHRHA